MRYSLLIFIIFCIGCTHQGTAIIPIYEISYPKRQNNFHGMRNEIKVTTTNDRSLIEISSRSGIGHGAIKLTQGQWSKMNLVRLYLGGLEGFTIRNAQVLLNIDNLSAQAYDKNGHLYDKKYLLDEKGYYELELPMSLFENGTTEISIHWVDFYR